MRQKLGIIQVRGLGDCIVVLPIAKYYWHQGFDVHIALDDRFCESFQAAAPYCTFVPVPYSAFNPELGIYNQYWYELPHKLLSEAGCTTIMSFPQHESIIMSKNPDAEITRLLKHRVEGPYESVAYNTQVFKHLKFDEYKYCVAQVPLKEKWNLDIKRNHIRENALYDKLVDKSKILIAAHLDGSNLKIDPNNIQYDKDKCQLIPIVPGHTDNIFDWLTILEKANTLMLIDSVFFNIVEQLNFNNKEKYFIRRSPIESTPVMGNSWKWIGINVPDHNTLFGQQIAAICVAYDQLSISSYVIPNKRANGRRLKEIKMQEKNVFPFLMFTSFLSVALWGTVIIAAFK